MYTPYQIRHFSPFAKRTHMLIADSHLLSANCHPTISQVQYIQSMVRRTGGLPKRNKGDVSMKYETYRSGEGNKAVNSPDVNSPAGISTAGNSQAESSLAVLMPGQIARIVCIDPSSSLAARLGDLGIAEGTWVRCERISLLGDPRAYRIFPDSGGGDDAFHPTLGGTVIALRGRDAVHVRVRHVPACEKSRQSIRTSSSPEVGVAWD
jgi:Fe2+ transport system protein FeoA